jgi:hypothetical protein
VLLLPPCLQVAANTKGIQLVRELIAEHSLQVVQAYMAFIQANAGAHIVGGWDDNKAVRAGSLLQEMPRF